MPKASKHATRHPVKRMAFLLTVINYYSMVIPEDLHMKNISVLEARIGIKFRNPLLLKQSTTHRSYCNEHRAECAAHNERLEFLGDAVLELVVTDYLMDTFPEKDEGRLTELRSVIVRGIKLTSVAEKIGLNDHMLLSRGESRDTKARGQILADAVEAVIGAIYKDQGIEAAQKFIARFFLEDINVITQDDLQDPKSRLQEIIQAQIGVTPSYDLISCKGPEHNKQFVMGLYLGDKIVARGTGATKRKAEQDAAKQALELMQK